MPLFIITTKTMILSDIKKNIKNRGEKILRRKFYCRIHTIELPPLICKTLAGEGDKSL